MKAARTRLLFGCLALASAWALAAGVQADDLLRVADVMTYGNFDLPPSDGQAGVMYLAPGIADRAISRTYRFDGRIDWHPLVALATLFALMAAWRLVRNPDGQAGPVRGLVQWLGFVATRLGGLRVAGVVPVPRCAAGVLPLLNCQACEMANGACPIGALQGFLVRGEVPTFVVGSMAFFGLAAGRWFCGWLCPFGMIEDCIARHARPRLTLPRTFEWARFVVLALLLLLPLSLALVGLRRVFPFCATICPSGLLLGLAPYYLTHGMPALREVVTHPSTHVPELFWLTLHGAALVGYLGLALSTRGRLFCRYLCPLGALLGLFNRLAYVRVVSEASCGTCSSCHGVCPVGLRPDQDDFLAWTGCIRCGRCVSACAHGNRRWIVGHPTHREAGIETD